MPLPLGRATCGAFVMAQPLERAARPGPSKGHFQRATFTPSAACQVHRMPTKSSYSAKPACHICLNTPALVHFWKYRCTVLPDPYSFGTAFHGHPAPRWPLRGPQVAVSTPSRGCREAITGRTAFEGVWQPVRITYRIPPIVLRLSAAGRPAMCLRLLPRPRKCPFESGPLRGHRGARGHIATLVLAAMARSAPINYLTIPNSPHLHTAFEHLHSSS